MNADTHIQRCELLDHNTPLYQRHPEYWDHVTTDTRIQRCELLDNNTPLYQRHPEYWDHVNAIQTTGTT